jgi:MYXO-CTERM domain-containing protein
MRKIIAFALACVLVAQAANAASVTISSVSGFGPFPDPHYPYSIGRPATAAGVPPNADIHEFLVTTDADILQIDQVALYLFPGTSLFQVPTASGGSDTERPSALFESLAPTLTADSWITTPGATSIAGNVNDPFGTPNNSWFDTTNDGPQSNFMFARVTLFGGLRWGYLSGRIQVAGAEGPESFPFTLTLSVFPEPNSVIMGAMGLLGLVAVRRRRVPM